MTATRAYMEHKLLTGEERLDPPASDGTGRGGVSGLSSFPPDETPRTRPHPVLIALQG